MIKKITIIGNSLTLRVRPVEKSNKFNKVYGSILESELNLSERWIVTNMGLGRWVSSDFFYEKDLYLRTFPNYYILNIGSVDAANREIPYWFAKIILERNNSPFYYIFIRFYLHILSKKRIRRFLTKIRQKPWVNSKKFELNILNIIKLIKKETNAKIIIIGINKGNQRIEDALPGTLKNYQIYNEILKEICINKKVAFINTRDLSSNEFFPDGIHYNSKGHSEISKRIIAVINKNQ